MSLICEGYMKATVCIGEEVENKKIFWYATGFIVKKKCQSKNMLFLVTNRHVLKDMKVIYLKLYSAAKGTMAEFSLTLVDKTNNKLYTESTDSAVDIAVRRLSEQVLEDKVKNYGAIDIDDNSFTSDEYIKSGGGPGSPIFMLGYPTLSNITLIDDHPICRKGAVARINKKEINKCKHFILDIQNFPGNSGSPIISCPELMKVEKNAGMIDKINLIGIVNSYVPYQEEVFSKQTGRTVEIRTENSGLAVANPVEFIKDLIDEDIKKYKND